MYFPYFRGKQNELILLRDNAALFSDSKFTPIIEPVKTNLSTIKRALSALIEVKAEFVLVVNPKCGDLRDSTLVIDELLKDSLADYQGVKLGYILDEDTELDDFIGFAADYPENKIALIHYGYSHGRILGETVASLKNVALHVFIEEHAHKRYRKNFNSGIDRVLIRDGFHRRSNREHPPLEHFSELHIMFSEEGMNGFGDFLITGDEYSESGGPAYAVAIHLTFLDSDDEDDMFIKHYVSDRTNTPADPGGKFLEALRKLIHDIGVNKKIFRSQAVREFESLNEKQHYPGLGSIKKLSMQHHVELLANFFYEEE